MNNCRFVSLLILGLGLMSCSGKMGNELTAKMYAEEGNLIKSKTSVSDVRQSYQYPEFTWKDKRGNLVYNYYYAQADHGFISYIPYISIITNRTKVQYYDITLTFDAKEKLIEKSISYKKTTCKNNFNCY